MWARIALSLSVAGIFVFTAVCDPFLVCGYVYVGTDCAVTLRGWYILCSLPYVTPFWCADTSMWARIALSLSVAGTFVFIAVCDPLLVSDSHLFVASPKEFTIWIFWETTSRIISVLSTLWFDSGSWTRCACTSLCNDRCRIVRTFLLWRRGSSP